MEIARLLALAGALALIAGAARADRIDDLIRGQMADQKIPGVAVAVLRDGKLVKIAGYGLANVETAAPVTPDTVFALASVTKQFTAAAVLMLVEEGKIGLDDPIRKHVAGLPDAWEPVTIRHLLTHTSGIFSYTGLPGFQEEPLRRYTGPEMVARVADRPLDFAPGAKWNYSNTGYYLLGMLIEKVSGKSWAAFLMERIFTPLGMTHTRMNDLEVVIPGRASGYGRSPRGVNNVGMVHPTQPWSAGALVSTARDMARWLAAVDEGKLLPKAAWERAFTPMRLSDGKPTGYGFGWELDRLNGQEMMGHGGGIPGFSTWDMRVPSAHLSLVVLTNTQGINPRSLGEKVAGVVVPALVPPVPKPIADPAPAVGARLRALIASLSQGEVDRSNFTKEFAAQITDERVVEAKELLGSKGALGEFALLERTEKDGTERREYRAIFGKSPIRVFIGLASDGKVAGLGFRPE